MNLQTGIQTAIQHRTTQTQVEPAVAHVEESNNEVVGTISLTASTNVGTQRQVSFDEGVVDNENLKKKKSKICCIYKKPHDPNLSSDSDSSCEGNEYEHQPKYHGRHHHQH